MFKFIKNQKGEAAVAIVMALMFAMLAVGVDIENKEKEKKDAAPISNTIEQSK